MVTLLMQDDVQCSTDLCEKQYKKALELMKNPTGENMHKAYDIMGPLAAEFDYLPAIMWMGDFCENALNRLEQATFWYKKAADMDDGPGARCYADMLISGRGVSQNPQLAFKYYQLAAGKGVPEAAFVCGEFYRNNGLADKAKEMYQKALNEGYEPAQVRLQQMANNN